MGFIRKIYDQFIYSEYGSVIGSTGLLSVLFILAFVGEATISQWMSQTGLIGLPFVFEFGTLVLTFLIVNICRRAINTTNRLRTIVYALAFSVGAGINFIVFSNTHWFNGSISYDSLMILSAVSKLLIAIGLMVGALIGMDAQVKRLNSRVLKWLIFTLWTLMAVVMLRINSGHMSAEGFIFDISIYTTLEYVSTILLIISFALHYRTHTLKKNRYLILFMNGIAILIMAQVIRLAYVQYTYLFHFIYSAYIFVGYSYIYNAIFGYNIVNPIQNLVSEEKQIKLYAENLEVIVDRRTKEMQNNNARLIQEIEYAKSIQQSLLPARKVNFNKVTFLSEYFPCERLSGDFFDIYRLDEENIGMYVLDVSGHGVSAALMTMFCNNYIKSSEKLIMKYRGLKPHRNLKHFYDEFNKMKFPDEMYMVMFFASYNVETGILTYASGGINCYPILMKRDGRLIYLDKSKGFPICKMSAFFTPTYTSETVQLDKGDRVIFYTDGLTDNVKNKTISEEDLEQVLYDYKNRSLKSLNEKLKSYIDYGPGESEDDITYFIMEA